MFGDIFGRQLAGWIARPLKGTWPYILVILRIMFIPSFLVCNTDSEVMPNYFTHDAVYIILKILCSISNGYTSAICHMLVPKIVSSEAAEKTGIIMAGSQWMWILIGCVSTFITGGISNLLVTWCMYLISCHSIIGNWIIDFKNVLCVFGIYNFKANSIKIFSAMWICLTKIEVLMKIIAKLFLKS